MTANEVHEAALALLFENRATAGDYNTFALPLFNLLLPELLETENGLRRAAGREELEQAPLLGSLEEEIPYDERGLPGKAARLAHPAPMTRAHPRNLPRHDKRGGGGAGSRGG